jgi:3-oxoacyl-[acyl-carrier protein] reductase
VTTPLLVDRVAVVTGAAQGIGFEIARTFALAGAHVIVADLNAEAAHSSATAIARESGMQAVGLACDVTSESDVEAAVSHAMTTFGRLDVLVNNAGVTADASLLKMTPDMFDRVLSVHLKGAWLGTRAAARVMREQKSGSIINMSSLSGKSGNPGQSNYSSAKAGIVGLTKSAAKELAHHNVRVNAIQPGLIRTAMTSAMPADVFAEREAAIPMKRAGEPSEIAGPALFLASELSSYVTGAVLEVGGGRLM